MLIDKVCGINEMELNLNMKNENHKPKLKSTFKNENRKSSFEFQHVFENEIKKEKYK